MQREQLLPTALKIGKLMLEYGAEIYRAEESIIRICKTYGAESVDVFAIPSSLIVTIDMGGDESVTMTKKVFQKEIDLDKVDQLNHLSRFICSNKPSSQEINKILDEIMTRKPYNMVTLIAVFAIVPAVFALFFGGNFKDAGVAMGIGILIKFVLDFLDKLKANIIFENVICSSIGSFFAILSVRIGIADNYDKIIIGTIMLLVPGLILTNSMRDFIMGDFLAGIIRLIEAILVATGIAIGVALILSIFGFKNVL